MAYKPPETVADQIHFFEGLKADMTRAAEMIERREVPSFLSARNFKERVQWAHGFAVENIPGIPAPDLPPEIQGDIVATKKFVISWYATVANITLEYLAGQRPLFSDLPIEQGPDETKRLYPNKPGAGEITVDQLYADLTDKLYTATEDAIIEGMQYHGKVELKTKGRNSYEIQAVTLDGEVIYDTNQITEIIRSVDSPEVTKVGWALFELAAKTNSLLLEDIRLLDIMREYYTDDGLHTDQERRREFTGWLRAFEGIKFYVTERKTKRPKWIGQRLISIDKWEAATREDGLADKGVIVKCTIRLMPGWDGWKKPARLMPKPLLGLHAKHDRGAIQLGKHICTRLDQRRREGQAPFIEADRRLLGEWGGYTMPKWETTRAIERDLAKLKARDAITDYFPKKLSGNMTEKVKIKGFSGPQLALLKQ